MSTHLSGSAKPGPAAQLSPDEPDWWRGAVIYEIYPRSFQDSNGDGIGDLRGITDRLGYVADLGVDAIWLAPFFMSPQKDFGYDISDYCNIDPAYGTLADFDALMAEAHRLGLKVMIDQVLSHSSDRHPWFVESRSSRDNPKADWYVWSDPQPDGSPPNNWLSVFGGSSWQWDSRRRQYYLHNFLTEQPDLNFHNEETVGALLDTVKFWLDRASTVSAWTPPTSISTTQHCAPTRPIPPSRTTSGSRHITGRTTATTRTVRRRRASSGGCAPCWTSIPDRRRSARSARVPARST